jgi:hypothetical protein
MYDLTVCSVSNELHSVHYGVLGMWSITVKYIVTR